VNPFREALHSLIALPGDELVLSSGYISQGKQFKAAGPDNLLPQLQQAVRNGLKRIVIIAGKFSARSFWFKHYREFITQLNSLPISISDITRSNWHAKIAIKIDRKRPVAAIVGSSNLTSWAYGVLTDNRFNKECDVIIWPSKANRKIYRYFSGVMEKIGPSNFIYFKKITEGMNEEERLNNLIKQLRQDDIPI